MNHDAKLLSKVAVPPAGHSFSGGFWTTHDIAGQVVMDSVLPRLVGLRHSLGTSTARRSARAARPEGKLLILHAPLVTNTAGPVPPQWIARVAVRGRRMHAKFGVLRFTRQGEHTYRGFVTSANLTHGGCFTNREVCFVEEVTGTRVGLPNELVTAFTVLAAELRLDQALLEALHLPAPAELTRVFHTLTGPDNLLKAAFGTQRADYAVVVSPGYASDKSDKPAKALLEHVKRRGRVYVATGHRQGHAPAFSHATIDALKAQVETTVWAIPELIDGKDDGRKVHRMVHAKACTLVLGDRATTLIGSANFTAHGLGLTETANRELMVRLDSSAEEFWAWDGALGGAPWPGRLRPPPAQHRDAPLEAVDISACFEWAEGQIGTAGRWSGTLTLAFGDNPPDKLTYTPPVGNPVELAGPGPHPFVLYDEVTELEAWYGDTPHPVPIACAPPDDPGFWTRKLPPPPDRERDEFLSWLGQARQTKGEQAARGAGRRVAVSQDRFTIPLVQRLARLARYRRDVASLSPDELVGLHSALGAPPSKGAEAGEFTPAEAMVARAVVSAVNPHEPAPTNPLLRALAAFARQDEEAL